VRGVVAVVVIGGVAAEASWVPGVVDIVAVAM
jgi:hypothetical protein